MPENFERILAAPALLLARVLLGGMFLYEGITKVTIYAAAVGYMQKFGLPGVLLPLVIATEIGAALCLLLGWQTRWAAFALAGFTVLAALIFHSNFTSFTETQFFEKDAAIAGGLLALFVAGAGRWSVEGRWREGR